MSAIISSVTTPLGLAALVVLTVTGLYQFSSRRSAKGIDKRAFWLILSFGLLGNVSYLVKELTSSDVIFRGEVRYADGRPAVNAVVDIAGVSRVATNFEGVFDVSIPPSRQSKEYSIYISANGIKGGEVKIKGPAPDFISLKFNPNVELSNFIEEHDLIYLSQDVGQPLITFAFRTKDELDGIIKILPFQLTVTRPDRTSMTFFPITLGRNNSMVPLEAIILDKDNQAAEYSVMSTPQPDKTQSLFQNISTTEGNFWAFNCIKDNTVGGLALTQLQTFFDSNFMWQSGVYQIEIRYRLGDAIIKSIRYFTVSADDAKKMYNIKARLSHCSAIAFDLNQLSRLAYSDGDAANTVASSLRDVP